MKTLNDIENVEVRKEIADLSAIFEDSFINDIFEFIGVLQFNFRKHFTNVDGFDPYSGKRYPKRLYNANIYFCIKDCSSKLDIKCKVLECFSRDCYKTIIASGEWLNDKYHDYVLEKVNAYLHTNFTKKDMELIYSKLGNGAHRSLCVKFINSGYDLEVLRDDDNKKSLVEICKKVLELNKTAKEYVAIFSDGGWDVHDLKYRNYFIFKDGDGTKELMPLTYEDYLLCQKYNIIADNTLQTFKARSVYNFKIDRIKEVLKDE